MFGQAKQITRATSSLKPNHIITNIMTRLQMEAKAEENSLVIQESEIHKLAETLGPTQNTVIPYSWVEQNSTLHQAHLEHISDFLLPGPGVWWKHFEGRGIEFLDGQDCLSERSEGPCIHHVRTTSLSDIDIYLQNKWEQCCSTNTILPAHYIGHYQTDGSLINYTMRIYKHLHQNLHKN